MKKLLALSICLVMILASFSSIAVFATGDAGYTIDEENKKITINTADGMVAVANLTKAVDGVQSKYLAYDMVLAADIDLTGKDYPGIGETPTEPEKNNNKGWSTSTPLIYAADQDRYYTGTFDGQGHTITGMVIDTQTSGNSGNLQGFFRVIGEGAVVKNLTFSKCTVSAYRMAGILAGSTSSAQPEMADGSDVEGVIIENVHIDKCTLNAGANYQGGLVGRIGGEAIIRNCTVNVTITAVRDNTPLMRTGLVSGGESDATKTVTYENVFAIGSISGNGSHKAKQVSGMHAYASSTIFTFINCVSILTLDKVDTGTAHAGFVSEWNKTSGTFVNCISNYGFVNDNATLHDSKDETAKYTTTVTGGKIIDDTNATAKFAQTTGLDPSATPAMTLMIDGVQAAKWEEATLPTLKTNELITTMDAIYSSNAEFLEKVKSVYMEVSNHVCDFNQKIESAAYQVVAPTCTEGGEYYLSCSCGKKSTETFKGTTLATHDIPDRWLSDDNNHYHACIVCGGEKTEEGAHTWGEWEVTKEATEKREGEKTSVCTVCNKAKTEKIAKITPADDSNNATTETPAEEKGCGGLVGTGAIAVLAVAGLACGIVAKKRED